MKKLLKKDNRGFTLAELLIVVAIIAVLVAISIPIFTSQLEKANEATDAANIRSAYAEAVVDALEKDGSGSAVTAAKMKCADWNKLDDAGLEEIGGVAISSIPKEKGKTVTVTITDGTPTFTVTTP